MSKEETQDAIVEADAELAQHPDAHTLVWTLEYMYSWGIRGDNTPEHAQYLGYLNGKELYPEIKLTTVEEYFKEVLSGKSEAIKDQKTLVM